VSAADLDLRGGVGHREYRPVAVADLRPEYRLGMGQIELDLRELAARGGQTDVNVRIGMGEARVRVPGDVCVVTDAKLGVGAVDIPERVGDGVDVDYAPPASRAAAARATLLINAKIGVGHLQVDGRNAKACA
jgi:predicted membrane protein